MREIGLSYSGRKGHRVEAHIGGYLASVQEEYGVGFERGRSRFIETDIDFAIPSLDDPWVILMVSFQETTSSGQSTKARDMLSAYERILRSNARYGENRAFVNFVDGGGLVGQEERPPAPGGKLPLLRQPSLLGHVGIHHSDSRSEKILERKLTPPPKIFNLYLSGHAPVRR